MKIGIIDVGGGLRDIFGAGIFDYLIEKDIFIDLLVGISAGSGNVITYMSKQKDRNYKSYMKYSKQKEYMSFRNYLKNRNYVDLEYIYNQLASDTGKLPFDYETFKKSKSKLIVVATDAESGKPVYFTEKDIKKNDYGVCAASSDLPVMNKPYKIKDKYYYDGSISDPIPIDKCIEYGCDKIIIILTRPVDFRKTDSNKKKLLYKKIKKEYPKFYEVLLNRTKLYNDELDRIINMKKDNILIVAPVKTTGLKTLTRDYDKMEELYKEGYEQGKAIEKFIRKK